MSKETKMTKAGKAAILRQLDKVERSLDLYLDVFASSEEIEKALRLVRRIQRRLEK